jgi:hypothetical protein
MRPAARIRLVSEALHWQGGCILPAGPTKSWTAVAVVGFFVVLWPGAAAAQSVEIGVKGGMTFATITGGTQEYGDITEEHNAGVGVAAGGAFAFRFGDTFALQPEVLFVQKAHEVRVYSDHPGDPFPLDLTVRQSLKYVEVPVLARFAIGGGGLHLLTGPSINFSLGGREDGERLDVGFVVGSGFYGSLVTLEARYEEGLTSTPLLLADDVAVRNRAFLLLFGVRR